MANKIIRDSGLPIFVKEVQVASGAVAINTPVREGCIFGLVGDTPRQGEDTLWYANVDTAAEIRIDAVAIAFVRGAPVYWTSGNAVAAASATGSILIGYAVRTKGAAAGPLRVQLDPSPKIAA